MKYFAVFVGIVCVFLIHGVYTEKEMECNADEVDYINNKINETLTKYTEKPSGNFMLTLVYNESYKRLTNSIVQKPAKMSDCKKADAALSRFLMVARNYDNIIHKMEQAMAELEKIQESVVDSIHLKYIALKLETLLHFSTSIFEAKQALRKYQSFKNELISTSDDNLDNAPEKPDEKENDE